MFCFHQVSAPAALSGGPPPAAPPIPQLKVDGESVKLEEDGESQLGQGQATQTLRTLEALSEKFPNTPGCTYTFKTLPDNALQVIIHMAKDGSGGDKDAKKRASGEKGGASGKDGLLTKAASVSSAPVESSSLTTPGSYPARLAPRMPPLLSRSISADTKMLSKELLKERIQQLISANEAIVDMPMADPPRSKGRFSRQNSDCGFHAWKLSDQVTKGSSSEQQSCSAGSGSTTSSRIAIPNITSVPLQPMPAEGEGLLRSAVLSTSVSVDTGRERTHKDLRRSLSASGVRMVDPATYLSLQHEVERSSLARTDSDSRPQAGVVVPSPVAGRLGGGEAGVAEVSLRSEDGNVCIPASLPLEVINAISSSATMTGNASGQIKIQFKLARARTEESQGAGGGSPVVMTSVTPAPAGGPPMIGQPSVQFPPQQGTTRAEVGKQDHSVIKNLLKRGAAVFSPSPSPSSSSSSHLAPPSVLDFPTSRHPKLKSESRVKSADWVYGVPHIVRSSLGAQQVVLTVKDIHSRSIDATRSHARSMEATHQSKSVDLPHHHHHHPRPASPASSSSDSLEQIKVRFVRDAILGIHSTDPTPDPTAAASTDPSSSSSSSSSHPKVSGEDSAARAEQGSPAEQKQHHCPDCGVSFKQVQILQMHKMYYCNKVKPMSLDEVVEVAKAKQGGPLPTITPSAAHAGGAKLQFHHQQSQQQSQQQLTVPRRSSNPALLKSHSTTEVEAHSRAAWQKEDYPQLRSQLTLRPSQSVDEGAGRGGEGGGY